MESRNGCSIVLGLIVASVVVSIALCDDKLDGHWRSYTSQFRKSYRSKEDETRRYAIWKQNEDLVNKHNQQQQPHAGSYRLSLNNFADMLPEEYSSLLTYKSWRSSDERIRSRRESRILYSVFKATVNSSSLPTCVNWTQYGWVGPVVYQGYCGSCWSYAAAAGLEAQYFNNTQTFVKLSEQNLIDCSWPQGNIGCDGGNMQKAYWYVWLHGIQSLEDYPDISNESGSSNYACKFDGSRSVMTLSQWMDVQYNDELALQQAVATVGPVTVGIDASPQEFLLYKDGIFHSNQCSSTQLNHAMLVVGYGVYDDQPYWLLRNSWSTSWGMNGYMMVARNSNNMCGIAADASFPLMYMEDTTRSSSTPVVPEAPCPTYNAFEQPTTTTIWNLPDSTSSRRANVGLDLIVIVLLYFHIFVFLVQELH